MSMKIAIASDHRGFEPKRRMLPVITRMGHEVIDFGCETAAACDYPDYAIPASRAVIEGKADAAILFDGSGIGMSITANKIRGIRAALVHDELTARRSREHHHCNVLCLGTDLLSEEHLKKIIEIFLEARYTNGRHDRRLQKIMELEEEERKRE